MARVSVTWSILVRLVNAMANLVRGDLYEDHDGGLWLVVQRPRWQEAPLLAANVHTGDLVPLDTTTVKRRVRLSLARMLRKYAEQKGFGGNGNDPR